MVDGIWRTDDAIHLGNPAAGASLELHRQHLVLHCDDESPDVTVAYDEIRSFDLIFSLDFRRRGVRALETLLLLTPGYSFELTRVGGRHLTVAIDLKGKGARRVTLGRMDMARPGRWWHAAVPAFFGRAVTSGNIGGVIADGDTAVAAIARCRSTSRAVSARRARRVFDAMFGSGGA